MRPLQSNPPHPVLEAPWTYEVVGLAFRCRDGQLNAELDLALRKEGREVLLRFVGVSGLEIEDGFPWLSSDMQILDIRQRDWEAKVQVCSFEQDPGIRFFARSVQRIDTQGLAEAAGPASGGPGA